MSSHSKAPWHVTDGHRYIMSTDDRIVADVRGIFEQPGNYNSPYRDVETATNARLIAAAPELADAVRDLLGLVSQISIGNREKLKALQTRVDGYNELIARLNDGS